jgi:hypothetical protein
MPPRFFCLSVSKITASSCAARSAQRNKSSEYELKVPYNSDEDLDQTMGELLGDIASQTDDRNCFSESNAHMHEADRHWG